MLQKSIEIRLKNALNDSKIKQTINEYKKQTNFQ